MEIRLHSFVVVIAMPLVVIVQLAVASNEPIQPIPTDLKLDGSKVALGEKLFHDKRFSKDNSISCASCHDLGRGGTDQLPKSRGYLGKLGEVNSPTVYNSGLNFRQFWDGRAKSLELQIDGPVHNGVELATTWPEIIDKLNRDAGLKREFQKTYPGGFTPANIKDAIAEFERSLITPNSRFDQYLRGDVDAISDREQRGYRLFKKYGCVACHQGANVGGNMFQTFGVMRDYFKSGSDAKKADLGRYNVTKKESDRHKFKVPSLRLVTLTPPYFHNGSAETLDEAVDVMVRHQLGRPVPDEDRKLIIEFLHTLVGDLYKEGS